VLGSSVPGEHAITDEALAKIAMQCKKDLADLIPFADTRSVTIP